ncbi:hypothetical protein NESM_000720100 [Novymonas esmeraldas]|uniref:Right handed beta helix domain-containing protein n=1 Tax=Novymonas esmeraldas TaxID=1808958 RepID=A0AAW0EU40_9TRYP
MPPLLSRWRHCASSCAGWVLSPLGVRAAAASQRPRRVVSITQPASHLTPTRTLFSGWGASKAAAAQSPPAHSGGGGDAPVASDASTVELQQLRQQVVDLKEALEASQEAVKQLLLLSAQHRLRGAASTASATPDAATAATAPPPAPAAPVDCCQHGSGACYVVRTSEELVDALRGRGSEHASRTVVLDGRIFLLDTHAPVVVDRARVSIVGNNAVVVGHVAVKGRGALLSASDVFFLAPSDMQLRQAAASGASAATVPLFINPTGRTEKNAAAVLMPVIGATVGASVHLTRCTVSSGRDGVYLGMGSRCTLHHVRVVNCIRGLYEGVGCRASVVAACTFQANRYHMVLLGPNNAQRSAQLFRESAGGADATRSEYSATFTSSAAVTDVLAPGLSSNSAIAIQQTKAQVVLQHNPIVDIYEDCWTDGAHVRLSERDATSGLSDPLF